MKRIVSAAATALTLAILFGGCTTAPATKSRPPLRVGITPDYPPLVYKQGAQVVGIEVDLASRLGSALDRPVRLVELPWDDLIPALLAGRIDIIMSGMSVTDERKVRIAFSDAYMQSSLVAAVKREDAARYKTQEDILRSGTRIGVLAGSSAEGFVARTMPKADRVFLERISDAKVFFDGNRIRMFVGDLCAVAWLVSENETDLAGVWIPLQQEPVGWGFQREDAALRESVNGILAGWKKDGTLKRCLAARVPYLDRVEWEAP